jgi:hypothetical protein
MYCCTANIRNRASATPYRAGRTRIGRAGTPIDDFGRCGDDFCATFYTQPKPESKSGPGHRNIALAPGHPRKGRLFSTLSAGKSLAWKSSTGTTFGKSWMKSFLWHFSPRKWVHLGQRLDGQGFSETQRLGGGACLGRNVNGTPRLAFSLTVCCKSSSPIGTAFSPPYVVR